MLMFGVHIEFDSPSLVVVGCAPDRPNIGQYASDNYYK